MDDNERQTLIDKARSHGFFAALAGEDELGLVVRAALYLEHEVLEFLRCRLAFPDELGKMQFGSRVKVALACGLRKDLRNPLMVVADIRNNFAHNLAIAISNQDADRLYNSFSSIERQALDNTYPQLFGGAQLLTKFREREPRDRFSLCIVTLWGALTYETSKHVSGTKA